MKESQWWVIFAVFLASLAMAGGCFWESIREMNSFQRPARLFWMTGTGVWFIWLAWRMGQFLADTARSK